MPVWHVMRFGDAEMDPQAPFKACMGCGKRMAEDPGKRCIGDKVTLTVMPDRRECRERILARYANYEDVRLEN